MPELFVLTGKLVGRAFALDGPATLGRAQDAGVRLPDVSVSREHARIEPREGAWWVVDLGSRNGVKVNGERVESARLADLDELTLGELVLRFRAEGEPAEAPPEPPAPAPAPAADDDGGFELEEEIDLGATRAAPRPGARRPAPAPEPKPAVELSDRDRERARILGETRGGGLFTGDLSQRPWPIRWGAYLLVLAATAGVFYGAYLLMLALRGA